MFEGHHLRPISPDGAVALPLPWIPSDGAFCAFVAPRARPAAVAVHQAAMAERIDERLAAANLHTGLSMRATRLAVVDGRVTVPAGMRAEASLGDAVVLVGKGDHFLIHDQAACDNLAFLPPEVPRR